MFLHLLSPRLIYPYISSSPVCLFISGTFFAGQLLTRISAVLASTQRVYLSIPELPSTSTRLITS